jgi:hypothetical protein
MSTYSITHTQNRVYLDKTGKAVQGFSIRVYLQEYDEELEITVPSLEPKTVETAVKKLLADRDAIAKLG